MKNPTYSQKLKSLSPVQRSMLDKEYQSNMKNGQVEFTSKVTGLRYAIPENKNATFKGKQLDEVTVSAKRLKPKLAPLDSVTESTRVASKPSSEVVPKGREAEFEAKAISNSSIIANDDKPSRFGLAASQLAKVLTNRFTKDMTGDKELMNLKVNEKNLDAPTKNLLYRAADAKVKATGKNSGNLDYEDYKRVLPENEYKILQDVKGGKTGMATKLALSNLYPAADIAIGIGGAAYKKDKKTGEITISDKYDFVNKSNTNEDGSFKKDWISDKTRESASGFFKLHDKLTEYDTEAKGTKDKKGTKDFRNRDVKIKVTPQDTVGNPRSLASRFSSLIKDK